jgi:hypothetical protein
MPISKNNCYLLEEELFKHFDTKTASCKKRSNISARHFEFH